MRALRVLGPCLTACVLAGCITAPVQPQGCRAPIGSSSIKNAPLDPSAVSSGRLQTLLGFDGKTYARPLVRVEAVEAFRGELRRSLATKGVPAGAGAREALLGNTSRDGAYAKAVSEAMALAAPTPGGVTTALMSIELMLDDLLNRANSAISSQLFSMRNHVAATISDMNVIFRDQMQDAYDKLNEQQRQALDRAMLLADQAEAALKELTENGHTAAADLLCQTTVNFANYPNTVVGLGLPLERCFAPDILCLSDINVRDTGSANMEQLLQFRGVNLLPNGEYPDTKLLVNRQEIAAPSAGGKGNVQLAIPGGLNGQPGDLSLRGPLLARVDFDWPKSEVQRRWFFELKPYQVRRVEVDFAFTIEGPVRTYRDQSCEVDAPGGSLGAREEFATCTIVPDATDKYIERCEEFPPFSENGDAGIRNRIFTLGACTWELRAKSKAFYGAGAWYRFIGRAHQIREERIKGPSFVAAKVMNQNEQTWVIDYPVAELPAGYKLIPGTARYTVNIVTNEGRQVSLTEAKPSDPNVGSALVVGERLTINLR